MLTMELVERLSRIGGPVLTAYVCTSPMDASQHSLTPAYLPSLKNDSRAIANGLSAAEQEEFLRQFRRVEEYLADRVPHERSLVILAGSSTWEEIPLQMEVQNEAHWGKPALGQLLWIAGEHKRYAIVVVDHNGMRLLEYALGELTERSERKFDIDMSDWRRKDMGHVVGSKGGRGSKRDLFEKRLDSQYVRFCDETAKEAAGFMSRNNPAALFLAGPERLVNTIERKLPRSVRPLAVKSNQDVAKLTTPELQKHLEPEIAEWERRHEEKVVSAVTGEGNGKVAGFDETLTELQAGKVRALVVARGVNPALRQCVNCGWMDRSGDPVCRVCRGERREIRFEQVLPELLQQQAFQIEVVSDGAAEALKGAEGVAAWLRKPKARSARTAV